MKIAMAQVYSIKGDFPRNIDIHLEAIKVAGDIGVSLIVFPELSLTGYEPEIANELAFSLNDERFEVLKEAAAHYGLYIMVGAPLKGDCLPKIGAVIFIPDGTVLTYEKNYLHEGEETYFSAGNDIRFLDIKNHRIGLGICADINNPKHLEQYINEGVSVYVAGVLITADGYINDTAKLCNYSYAHRILVAMANHTRPTGGWQPCGKSAAWYAGHEVAVADSRNDSLVISEEVNGKWLSWVVLLDV
ncbi:carbon-nitrogen hydrolase family protein [Microbulbifer sp. CnH-101-G]|uniref:carbon-nitrogen hydrolase family protein n=1 Tax=Microbulbifer sp. CnH-101-G TaxID=3243393 RepID=UPI00403959BA